ncbi:unnamed protein product [Ectocarpus sp. 12 AP-2014]
MMALAARRNCRRLVEACGGGDACSGGGGYGGGGGGQAAGFPSTTHRPHDRTSGHPTTAPFDNPPKVGNRPCLTLRYNRRCHPRTRAISMSSSPSRSTRSSTGKTRSSARRCLRRARRPRHHARRTRRRARRPRR